MIIEHDKIVGFWIVWLKVRNLKFEMFRAKTKRECKAWLDERGKDETIRVHKGRKKKNRRTK